MTLLANLRGEREKKRNLLECAVLSRFLIVWILCLANAHDLTGKNESVSRQSSTNIAVNHGEKSTLTGFWFNKGSSYEKCPSTDQNEQDDCKSVLLGQTAKEMTREWARDYGELFEKIVCTLKRLNCPSENKSFQLHDIPCQSSCLAGLIACGGHVSGMLQFPNPHWHNADGCPNIISSALFHQPQLVRQFSRLDSYPPPYLNNPYMYQPDRDHYVHDGAPNNQRVPMTLPMMNYQQLSADRIVNRYPRSINTYQPPLWRRWPGRIPYDRRSYDYQLTINRNRPEKRPMFRRGIQKSIELTEEDCYLLPAGGCSMMSVKLVDLGAVSSAVRLKVNTGCPADTAARCKDMFPQEFSRREWAKGGYTVVAIIKLSQVLWWFGRNDRYQPFFRFHVVETLQTDIHPYDDKMILTYSWPTQCVCPGELTAGKTYIMLTHSIKDRQTLNITRETKFLSKVKRYTKRLACWKGSCSRRRRGNRRRRVPNPYWRYPVTIP